MHCAVCNKIVSKDTKSGACSRACNAIIQNKKRALLFNPPKCRHCGKTVERRSSRAVFCNRTCHHRWWSGKNHYKWKGGRKLHSEGYVYVMQKDHPCADRFGYVLEHRILVERHLLKTNPFSEHITIIDGIPTLKRSVVIHHKNGVKHDNRIRNLLILSSQSEHMKLDNPKCN